MNKKKIEERKIIEEAYKKDYLINNLIINETPDFILINQKTNKKIGIEVTTLYGHPAGPIATKEKFAKTFIENNKPGKNQKKKKPKFLKNMGVAKIEGEGAKGIFHDDYVIWEVNTLKDFFIFFENIIQKKDKSYVKTPQGLEYVNLLAKDMSTSFRTDKLEIGDFYGILRQESIYDTIIGSNFQEINLLTSFKGQQYNIGLKWYLFTSEYFLFEKFWKESPLIKESYKEDLINQINNFLIILKHLGFRKIFFYEVNSTKYILCGTNYLKIDTISNSFEELSFFATEVNNLKNLEDAFKSYKTYTSLYNSYREFRKDIVPKFPEGMFVKL